ncbi:MAG: hypothetical protein LBV33_06045 [Lachnospiraceae bacterium]|jgi:hypothetical protein|nr:hypothetical protein [Lachnospiraceae bacterium]
MQNLFSKGRLRIIITSTAVLIAVIFGGCAKISTLAQTNDDRAIVDTYIRLKAVDGTWASVSGTEAETYQGQLDEKIAYIEEVYANQKTPFIISEDISLAEATNTVGSNYMYEHSSVYREMVKNIEMQLGYGEGNFYRFEEQEIGYERFVLAVENQTVLYLHALGLLQTGEVAVWLVSPDGEIVSQIDRSANVDERIEVEVEPGLWSIILVNYFDQDYTMSGQLSIQADLGVK